MKNKLIPLALLMLPLTSFAGGESTFYTGLWEYTIDVKMQAMPESELKRVRECIKELNDVIGLFKPDPSCSVSHVQADASRLSWKLYCKTNRGTYHGDASLTGNERGIQGRVELQSVIPGMKNIMRTTYLISGEKKGACR